jgi:hypothetical protein
MDLLIALLLVIGSFIVGIAGNLLASELYDRAPSLARWLIDCAVARLPESERERCREEWYADNNAWPGGKLGKVRHAAGCWFGAHAVGQAHHGLVTRAPGDTAQAKQSNENPAQSTYANGREDWQVAFTDELEEVKELIARSRQDRAGRAEYYQQIRETLFACLAQVSDDLNADGDLIDAFVQLLRNTSIDDEPE